MENKRAWLYCRSAHKDEWALVTQQKRLEAYAAQQGFVIVGISTDQTSGLNLDRLGLAAVSRAVIEGKTDVVLVSAFDRICRNPFDAFRYIDFLNGQHTQLLSIADGVIDGNLFPSIYAYHSLKQVQI